MAAYRVGDALGVDVETVIEHMPYHAMAERMAYYRLQAAENDKLDYYLARITAILSAQIQPKKRFNPTDFLLGRPSHLRPGHKDLRAASADEIKALFLTAFPNAIYNEGPNDG